MFGSFDSLDLHGSYGMPYLDDPFVMSYPSNPFLAHATNWVCLAFGRMTCLACLVCLNRPIYPTRLTLYFGLFGLSNFLNCVHQSYWVWCSCGLPNLFSPPCWPSLLDPPKWFELPNLFGMLGLFILPGLSNLFFSLDLVWSSCLVDLFQCFCWAHPIHSVHLVYLLACPICLVMLPHSIVQSGLFMVHPS